MAGDETEPREPEPRAPSPTSDAGSAPDASEGHDDPDAESAAPTGPAPVPSRPRRRLLSFLLLVGGLVVAALLSTKAPHEQHVRFVLGAAAPDVTGLDVQYVPEAETEASREASMRFEAGQAPRIVSHEPQLADGSYRLRIDVDMRQGRRSLERQVTLTGGGTSVDLAAVLTRSP